jgi:hypothetical protein
LANKKLIGKIILDIEAIDDDTWTSKVTPVMLTTDRRAYVKLALITAAVQTYMKDSLGFINNLVKNVGDIDEIEGAVHGKVEVDVDKYQTKLPFAKGHTESIDSQPDRPDHDNSCGGVMSIDDW